MEDILDPNMMRKSRTTEIGLKPGKGRRAQADYAHENRQKRGENQAVKRFVSHLCSCLFLFVQSVLPPFGFLKGFSDSPLKGARIIIIRQLN